MLREKASINAIRKCTGYGVNILKRIASEHNIPVINQQSKENRAYSDFSNVFVENGMHGNSVINRIIKDYDIIPYDKCWLCGLSEWINGKLILEIDHINGISNDHRIENLRFLCPNCHSQTETFRSKNITTHRKVSDEVLIDAIKSTENLHQALIKVGLAPKGGNYSRAQKLKVALTQWSRSIVCMTSHELANTLLQYPNLPLQVGNNITNFNRGSAIVGNLKVEITNNRIMIDTDTPVLGYTPEEQQHIFDLCLNDEDWRKPVHAVIPDKIFNQYGEIKIARILEDAVGRIEISRIEAGYLITGNGYSANGQSRKVQVTKK